MAKIYTDFSTVIHVDVRKRHEFGPRSKALLNCYVLTETSKLPIRSIVLEFTPIHTIRITETSRLFDRRRPPNLPIPIYIRWP